VKVSDDVRGSLSRDPWDEDAIELFFDFSPFSDSSFEHPEAYSGNCFQIAIGARRPEASRIVFAKGNRASFGKTSADVKEYDGSYEILARLELNCLSDPKTFGFDISLDDSDAASRKAQLVWSGSAENHENRSSFGIMEFN